MGTLQGQPISQPSAAPTTKVAAGGIAGAVTVVLVYVLAQLHIVVPGEVASSLTVIFSFVTSYLVKNRAPADAQPNLAGQS